jgi:hypothetical protein
MIMTPGITDIQRAILLSSYIPFFLVPFGMAVDMVARLSSSQKRIKTN